MIRKWFDKIIIRAKEPTNTHDGYMMVINPDGSSRIRWNGWTVGGKRNPNYSKGDKTKTLQFIGREAWSDEEWELLKEYGLAPKWA